MGLSVVLMAYTDTCWHASYSSFGRFREQLAKTVGINLDDMVGFCDSGNGVEWSGDEPFYELLNHDDNEGELYYYECENLLEDFRKYTSKFKTNALSYYVDAYEQWVQLLEECMRTDGVLVFR